MTSPNEGNLLNQVHTAVIRLDAKVDNVQSEMRYMRDEHRDTATDHEARLRKIESTPHVSVERFAALESRPYVSPATVWKFIGALTAIASVAVAIINSVK
jgi:hypothetical protein